MATIKLYRYQNDLTPWMAIQTSTADLITMADRLVSGLRVPHDYYVEIEETS